MRTHLLAAAALVAALVMCLHDESEAQQTPADWKTLLDYSASPLNPENSPLQPRNSPLDWRNSPINPESQQLRSPTTGEPLGYVVPRSDGGVNVFAPDGQWIGVSPGRRR